MPTDHASFVRQFGDRTHHDFARGQYGSWGKYQHEFITAFDTVVPSLKARGVSVEVDVTLKSFARFFDRFSVIVLFAHWSDDEGWIEFDDGYASSDDVAAVVPRSFSGVVDLCVCHPQSLVRAIKAKAPNSIVKFTQTTAIPNRWLHLYSVVFAILDEEEVDYATALQRAVAELVHV